MYILAMVFDHMADIGAAKNLEICSVGWKGTAYLATNPES